MRRLTLCILSLILILPHMSFAQDRYENPDLGVSFNLPAGWEVRSTVDSILAASTEALAVLDSGATPDDLVFRVITSTFVNMNIPNATALPDQLERLVPTGISAPAPTETEFGGLRGWEIEYLLTDGDLTSRVGLVALPNGRLALIRGFASTAAWNPEAYEELKASLEFFTPTSLADPLADLPDRDGGVLWHYQAAQPADTERQVRLGGVAYDPFLLLYAVAGERGLVVLDQTDGRFVNYLGPLFNDDNWVDVAISLDARLYVANATTGDNNQVLIVNRTGTYEYGFGLLGEGNGQFAPNMPQTIAVSTGREPKIWVVSEGHSTAPAKRLYQFDRFGNLLISLDIESINPNLDDIRIANNVKTGALYLIGRKGGGINVLDAEGNVLVTNLGTEIFALTNPIDIAIAPNDNLIVATDSVGYLEFAPSGLLLDRFGIPVSGDLEERFRPGEMFAPAGTVVGPEGEIYFAETHPTSGFSQIQSIRMAGDGRLVLPSDASNQELVHNTLSLDPAAGGGDLEYGQVVQGSLNNSKPTHRWIFRGAPGDQIRITMRDISPLETLDTFLVLIDPNQIKLGENDDGGELLPADFAPTDSVLEFELSVLGNYTIEATRFGGRGDYELSLEKRNP